MPPPRDWIRASDRSLGELQMMLNNAVDDTLENDVVVTNINVGKVAAAVKLKEKLIALATSLNQERQALRQEAVRLSDAIGVYSRSLQRASDETAMAAVAFPTSSTTPNLLAP